MGEGTVLNMHYVIQTPVYFKMLKECLKSEEYAEAFKTRGHRIPQNPCLWL